MAVDPLLPSYEHALLLLSLPASLHVHQNLHSLIATSSYACILREHSAFFHYSAHCGSPSLFVRFPTDVPPLDRLVCGIAALLAFIQTNWTGPEVQLDPADIFGEGLLRDAVNSNAIENLAMDGEPAYHLAKKAGFLWLAKEIFAASAWEGGNGESLRSLPVWRFRCSLVNLRLLDTPVPFEATMLDEVQSYISFIPPSSPYCTDLTTSLTLLIGLYHAQFVHFAHSSTKASNEEFLSAAQTARLRYELTGRLGKRTKWQTDEKSQLVVLAESRIRDDDWRPREAMALQPELNKGTLLHTIEALETQPDNLMLHDDTLLERTQFTYSIHVRSSTASTLPNERDQVNDTDWKLSIDPNRQPILHPLDQCIMLALSLSITNTSPLHGLTTTQIQAFVSRVLADGSQNWSIHSMALLLRSRLESNRTRTVERGLLQMQSLVDQLKLESVAKGCSESKLEPEKGATPTERLKYFFSLNLPSVWEIERELATRYLSLGVTRSALEIFTRLEMWEDVARCYASLGEEDKAVSVVKDLLEGRLVETEVTMLSKDNGRILSSAQRAKLYCLLGDLENDNEQYRTAWTVSGGTSSRAMRALGQSYFRASDWSGAQDSLEKALDINPLFGKVWFVLGCAAMRNQDWLASERAFRRCTALEEEDGEAWNNLATVLLKQIPPSSNTTLSADEREKCYSRKRTAFTCLGQAIKHAYDSWRIWTNYLLVCSDVGELSEACRAITRLVELRGDKDGEATVDLDVLDRLVAVCTNEAEEAREQRHADGTLQANGAGLERGLVGRVRSLFESTILPRITDSSHIYRSYARFLFSQGDVRGSIQAHVKAYRVDVVLNDTVTSSKNSFERSALRVQDTVDILRNLGNKDLPGGKNGELVLTDWKSQARSMLRSFLGRTKQVFGEEETWERLNQEYRDLKTA